MLDGRTAALIVGYTARLILLRHFILRTRPPAANDNRKPRLRPGRSPGPRTPA